jgi:hypothetical protein
MLGLRQRLPRGVPLESFYCLMFARRVVEHAMGLRERGFYDLVLGVDSNPTANELELLLKKQRAGWVKPVTDIQAGDLLWWYDQPKGWGHVGIAVVRSGALWVAQNTMTKGGVRFGGALALVKLTAMGIPSTVIRIGG